MGFIAPALPFLGKGLMALGAGKLLGGMFGKKNNTSMPTSGIQGGMNNLIQSQTGLGRELTRMGKSSYSLGSPAYGKALSYYETLLGGNRAAMDQALAPETAQITDTFRGAAKNLDRQGVRGGEKTMAAAELNRDRANQLGQLRMGGRANAAGALGSLGLEGMRTGFGGLASASGAYSGAGSLYDSMLNYQGQKDAAARQAWGSIGGGLASAFLPWVLGKWGGGGKA